MFDPGSFIRVLAFAVLFAGIEYRYVNRYEKEPLGAAGVFAEKPVFWVMTPYHLFLVLPTFIVVSFAPSLTAWAGNTFFLAVSEDVLYFVWRRKRVTEGEWTTTLFGSLKLRGVVIPVWWVLDGLLLVGLYLLPV